MHSKKLIFLRKKDVEMSFMQKKDFIFAPVIELT